MRIAILADIHGNMSALEAVIDQLERHQPDHVILDGDLINAVPFSSEVVEYVRKSDWSVVRGNHEFYYLNFGTDRARPGMEEPSRWGQLHWLVEQITPEQAKYLAVLPDDRTIYLPNVEPFRVTHGVPGRNRVGFYNEQPEQSIAAEIEQVGERTLISAHTHVQVDRHVRRLHSAESDMLSDPHRSGRRDQSSGDRPWHVINPGSVGLPLNGDTGAQFALIDSVPEAVEAGGWKATHFSVPYDRRPALEAYTTSGMLEAGGPITQLFYWELVTAEPEIIRFLQWARANGHDPEEAIEDAFRAYVGDTRRDQFIYSHDPLYNRR